MNITAVYLIQRFLYRILEFLRHWYLRSFYIYSQKVLNFLEEVDKILAFRVTLTHLFQPLYKDYTLIGYVLGFVFRMGRVILGVLIYLLIIAIALFIYLLWLLVPVYILYRIFI